MRLGPVTKLDKRNKTTSKKIDNDVMSADCDVIFDLWPIRKPDSGCMVCKTYIFINRVKKIFQFFTLHLIVTKLQQLPSFKDGQKYVYVWLNLQK